MYNIVPSGLGALPDIDYRFVDHAKYLEAFIEKLGLKNVTLVLLDWGTALKFNYAMQNEDNVKGIAFMEAILMPLTWDQFQDDVRETFRMFRDPEIGYDLIVNENFFVEQILPAAILRNLTEEEPFKIVEVRRPVWVWPNEIPIDGQLADVHQIVTNYSQWLQETPPPKLLLHTDPGVITNALTVEWSKANLENLETVDLGQGIHYLQEDHPNVIDKALSSWIRRQNSESSDPDPN